MAAQLGDRRWRSLVARHHQVIRRELKGHRGREVDTAGDGFFATFESPTDGVACAAAAIAAVHGLGLRIRAGLHTGEVELSGEKVGGIAVHIAARLLAMAGPEEALVSGTVRDLVAGSGLEFQDRGVHELKGVPGEWRVHALVLPPLDASVVASAEVEEVAAGRARRRRLIGVGALVATLVVVLAASAGIVLMPRTPPPIASGPDSAVAYATADGRAIAGARTGRGPASGEVVDGSLWVANVGSGTLTRVERDGAGVSTVGQVGSRPSDLASGDGLLWVADRYSDQLTALDARTGEIQRRVDLHASAIDVADGSVWAADDLRDVVRRLDPRTGAELDSVALPEASGASDVVAGEGAVWIAAPRTGRIHRIDPTTGEVAAAAVEVPGVERISAAGSDLWAVSPADDTATRVDLATSRVAVTLSVCDSPIAVAAVPDGGGAWVACSAARALWHVDAAGAPVRAVALDGVPTDLALDGDRVWVTLRQD
jgi:streptogramin lyase